MEELGGKVSWGLSQRERGRCKHQRFGELLLILLGEVLCVVWPFSSIPRWWWSVRPEQLDPWAPESVVGQGWRRAGGAGWTLTGCIVLTRGCDFTRKASEQPQTRDRPVVSVQCLEAPQCHEKWGWADNYDQGKWTAHRSPRSPRGRQRQHTQDRIQRLGRMYISKDVQQCSYWDQLPDMRAWARGKISPLCQYVQAESFLLLPQHLGK